METNNASLITDEYLACGTSLAENEYTNNYEEEEKASSGINAAAISPDGTMHPKTANLLIHSNNIQSISDLRSMIVSDLLQDARSGGWTIFESPFEDFSNRGLVSSSDDKKSTRNTSRRFYKLPLVYCDQTASNRCLVGIERYITNICLPLYGNTHTNTSITGSQSTAFVAEARQIIAENTNSKITGKASLDVILFA